MDIGAIKNQMEIEIPDYKYIDKSEYLDYTDDVEYVERID